MTYEQVRILTLAQLMLEIDAYRPKRDGPGQRRETEERRAEGRVKAFDALCAKHGLTATMLANLPPERILELLRSEGHVLMAPQSMLPGLVKEWAGEYAAQRKEQ